jgi:hypothetical protein
MRKIQLKQVHYHTISEWRAASVPSDAREFLERCDAERQEDIPATIRARVEELLASKKLASKTPSPSADET